jgi:hypothetical protein
MKNLEDNLQAACVRWFRYQYPELTLFAIPNGGSRNPIEAAKMKRTGTLAGVADLFLMSARGGFYGLWIECKAGKNRQTDAQQQFEAKALEAGYDYAVIWDVEQFMDYVNNYLK